MIKEKKDQFISIRLSNTEKEEIIKFAKANGFEKTSDFIRKAITVHIEDLQNKVKKVNPIEIAKYIVAIKSSFGFLISNIDEIDREICSEYILEEINTKTNIT